MTLLSAALRDRQARAVAAGIADETQSGNRDRAGWSASIDHAVVHTRAIGSWQTAQRLANVPVAVLLLAQTVPFWRKLNESDCDNMAGGCIRARQELAMAIVMFACVAAASLCAWNAASAAGKSRRPRWRHGVLLVSSTLLLVIWIADPIGHLNNRFSGWLASATVFPVR